MLHKLLMGVGMVTMFIIILYVWWMFAMVALLLLGLGSIFAVFHLVTGTPITVTRDGKAIGKLVRFRYYDLP